ncbi:MAG: hypothetical protein IPJ74_11780 [Saprospiraceae bacterium]|nr:hypothetical protein [Saprospiraceae bacterium]
MKNAIKISLLLLIAIFTMQSTAEAQNRSRENDRRQSEFASRLWYGGGLTLGFTSSGNESLFQIGLSPMVGYKIFEPFSVGPRVNLLYSHYRINFSGDIESANAVSWSAGVFTRYKIVRNIFAHVEYEFENAAVFSYALSGLEALRRERNNFYVGGGYNSGGTWGYEILLLFNTLQPENDINPPFSFRIGFTRNF